MEKLIRSAFSLGSAVFFADPSDAERDLKNLKNVLLPQIRRVLEGMEKSENIGATAQVRKDELKPLAYDIDDVLDEWKTAERLRAAMQASAAGRKRVRDPVTSLLTDTSFVDRIRKIRERYDDIISADRSLDLSKGKRTPRQRGDAGRPPSSSLVDYRFVDVAENRQEAYYKFAASAKVMKNRLTVFPVVGMGGVGKTNFAKLFYNTPGFSKHFPMKGWVSVSRRPELMNLMNSIVEGLTGKAYHRSGLGTVQELLGRMLRGQRFLLVLDDVHEDLLCLWDALCATLNPSDRDVMGSMIIVTTQNDQVADKIRTVAPYYPLGSSSPDHCWSLFEKRAFFGREPSGWMLEIGRKIVDKCEGSPFAAKHLGDRLQWEDDRTEWERLLESSDTWDEVLSYLRPSYHRLPAHLQRCFLSCSMFPGGYHFRKGELVRLWMAQGFVEAKGGRQMEDEGVQYFDDLFSRSFFLESDMEEDAFVMPHLLRALAQSIAAGEYHQATDGRDLLGNLPRQVRHLSVTTSSGCELTPQSLNSFPTDTVLRSFLVIQTSPTKNAAHISLAHEAFKRLWVLDVRHTDISTLPNTIGSLKHLRCLNLRATKISVVQDSLFELYNLQTLDLSHTDITKLPNQFDNLEHLGYLDVSYTRVGELPESVCKLQNLRTLGLSYTCIEKLPDSISNLKSLRYLYLQHVGITTLPDSIGALCNLQKLDLSHRNKLEDKGLPATIGNLSNLRYLSLNSTCVRELPDSICDLSTLQTLDLGNTCVQELPRNVGNMKQLQNLVLSGTKIKRLPNSIKELTKLEHLRLGTRLSPIYIPTGIGKLSKLRTLQAFTLGQNDGSCGIEELKDLLYLETLDISCLSNVVKLDDAEVFILQNKRRLSELKLMWYFSEADQLSEQLNDSQISADAVLESLEPHTNLKKLDISSYPGSLFPEWMGNPSFSVLEHVVLKNCIQGRALPSLGQLPQLQVLYIDGVSVKRLEQAFCGFSDGKSFPSLKTLSFCNMHAWEGEWDGVKDGDFPCLNELSFFNCPKLKRVPDLKSPKLNGLAVERCPQLTTIPMSSSLQVLVLNSCDNLSTLPSLPSLQNLTLMYCPCLAFLPYFPVLVELLVEECEQLLPDDIPLRSYMVIRILSPTAFLAKQ